LKSAFSQENFFESQIKTIQIIFKSNNYAICSIHQNYSTELNSTKLKTTENKSDLHKNSDYLNF